MTGAFSASPKPWYLCPWKDGGDQLRPSVCGQTSGFAAGCTLEGHLPEYLLGRAACFEHNAADGAWKAQVLLLGNLLV